jgi:hypothetical protein
MVVITIDSDFLNGKECFEKQIRTIIILNEGSIVDTTDMKGVAIKKLEVEVELPDKMHKRWRPNQTAKKSLVKLFGPDTKGWIAKKIKLNLDPYQDSYAIKVDELDTMALNGKGKGSTLL